MHEHPTQALLDAFTIREHKKGIAGLKDWMGEHNAVIMSVLCLVIGVKLIGDAISGLTA